jgi:hypothetical protein
MNPRNFRTSSGVVGRGQLLTLDICFIYLDDLIIFSKTYEEHLDRIQRVLQRLHESGLKLSPTKCTFFQEKVKYIGHIVAKDGFRTSSGVVGRGQLLTFSILSGSGLMPSFATMWPMYFTFSWKNVHFVGESFKPLSCSRDSTNSTAYPLA